MIHFFYAVGLASFMRRMWHPAHEKSNSNKGVVERRLGDLA